MIRQLLGFGAGAATVAGVCTAGLVYSFDQTHRIDTDVSTLRTAQISVGSPWAGTIKSVHVVDGQEVSGGQELLTVQSPTLVQALAADEEVTLQSEHYEVRDDGTAVVLAPNDGIVRGVPTQPGTYVVANNVLATIDVGGGGVAVESHVTLTAEEYQRLGSDPVLDVVLPDGSTVRTDVYDVDFDVADAGDHGTRATVRSRSEELEQLDGFSSGAPVEGQLLLGGRESIGGWAAEQVVKLVTPDGFRK